MKKFRFYIFIFLITVIVGFIIYLMSDFSMRVRLIYSLFKEEDKNKIITRLVEKVESDTMKHKLEIALKKFSTKIENDEYTDEHLEDVIREFEQISNLGKIDSSMVESFYQKINRNF